MILEGTEPCLLRPKETTVWHNKLRPGLRHETIPRLPISNEGKIFTVPDLCSKGVKTKLIKVSVLKVDFRWRA